MSWAFRWLRSSLGSKVAMAVTGVLLFAFLIAHMAGNLLVFAGQDALNAYAHMLQNSKVLLWGLRLGLLVVFVLHVATAVRLVRQNRAARPERYAQHSIVQASLASQTMIHTGIVTAAFVVYHLLHFTVGAIQRENFLLHDAAGRHDVYTMVVLGFRNPLIALSYVVAVGALGLHLSHGLHSMFQSVGWRHPRYTPALVVAAPVVAALLTAGFLAVPIAVLLGLVPLPE
ncbi:MAG TPA: succinate dehydrogenase cytochrome b subunit [Planctomycetota bacterium]|nr:succinate dehydrogenase cytochrome b subunit [Planctomycetota bacterium]